jgi:hypothetical protein
MKKLARSLLFVGVLVLCFPEVAEAGMGSFTLSDLARLRIQGMSFFGAGFLLSAWIIQRLWNYLRRDFVSLPRLTYPKALGVVTLWGLLFVLVMTMIAGARELMTPGAWIKEGRTYHLASESELLTPVDEGLEDRRRQKLESLRGALWLYAQAHDRHFPPTTSAWEIPADRWQVPDLSGMRYLYVPGQIAGKDVKPIAYEPQLFGLERLVLFTTGEIRSMTFDQLAPLIPAEKRP